MDPAEQTELQALKAENERLKAAVQTRATDGLNALAAHARKEAADYQRLLAGGDAGEVMGSASEAASIVLADMGLV